MSDVILGKTGIRSPKNGFGALPIQRVSKEYAAMLLRKAYDAGFTFFDTARAYSDSEEKIGYALSDVRDQITIATKTGATDVETFWDHLETSLKNLKTDYIDLYQFHTPSFCPKPGDGTGLYEAMLEAKAQGKIRHIGITNHRLDVAEEAIRSGLYETLQFPFCYLLTRSDAAYAWLDQFDNVLPIWGVQREGELDEFIHYFNHPPAFTGEIREVIEKDRQELIGNFCRACGYCMPCPMGIQINSCARMSQLIRRSPSAGWLSEKSQQMMMNIEKCVECGQCKSKCPYELDTPLLLKQNLEDYKNILSGKTKI